MTEDTEPTKVAQADAELAVRFANLRAAEATSAPAIAAETLKVARVGTLAAIFSGWPSALRIAAGIGALALTFVLFSESPEDDPAALYASIMDKQFMQTDTLLEVSPGIWPATTGLPLSYDLDIEFEAEDDTN